ncbi:Translocation protein Sec62 [Musa troglodytarum]|uniref:Translocation protein SEC62 n=1 Tax=Musa troglodytarum TaxID=320322 RepID=A0A9E7FGE7_9LILI|nr:Translocation protein Sec62 [Musa troglodytarum]URD95076.1 Translocation protein Sec62 [Musa troglodytarum]URD95080.1 Translocation protein Sec62 [Musa troglodytarum]
MKRHTLWQTILSFLWPLVALAVCLFPVYPYQCKIVELHSSAGALLFLVTLLLLRGAIFGFLYIIWESVYGISPDIIAEEATFRELIRFWPPKDEGEPPKWTSRCPKKVYNIIDEWSLKLALTGMMDKQHPVANETETKYANDESQAANVEKLLMMIAVQPTPMRLVNLAECL